MSKQEADIKEKAPGSGAMLLFSLWAIGLLIAFLAYRGTDLGQLPDLFGGLSQISIFGGTGYFQSMTGFFIAGGIYLAWFGLGSFIASFFGIREDKDSPVFLKFAIVTAIGAAAWSLIWFFLGIVGAFNKITAAIALFIGLGLAVWQLRSSRKNGNVQKPPPDKEPNASILEKILYGVAGFPVVLAVIASLAPPTAKDTLLYHFSVPKVFVAQGSSAFVEGNIASYLTLGTEMHYVWAMLLGSFAGPRVSEAAAGATAFMFFPLLLMAIYGWAGELGLDRIWRLLAVFTFSAVPTAYHVAASAYIDLALALYVTLAIYSLGRWWKSAQNKWLILVSIFLGAALAVKLTALFVFAAFALMILLRARQAKDENSANVGKVLGTGIGALIAGGLLASPWYLRTWKETGSPIFPFYMNIWKGTAPGWDVERSGLFQLMNSRYGGVSKNALDYILSPFKISIMAQPEQAIFFDGVIGVVFLFGIPLLIWALWKYRLPAEIKVGLGICLVMFLFWLFSSEQLRYLLPIFPMMAIGIVLAAKTISENNSPLRTGWQTSLAVLSFAGLLTGTAWFLQKNPLGVVFGGETKSEYLTRNLDYYPYYQTVEGETPADSKVWLINMRRDSYNLDRAYFSDYLFEDWTLKKMVWESRSSGELRDKARQMGFNYILVRHDVLLDYAQSAIVDDQKARPENENKLKILKEVFFDQANAVRTDKKFSLVKIF